MKGVRGDRVHTTTRIYMLLLQSVRLSDPVLDGLLVAPRARGIRGPLHARGRASKGPLQERERRNDESDSIACGCSKSIHNLSTWLSTTTTNLNRLQTEPPLLPDCAANILPDPDRSQGDRTGGNNRKRRSVPWRRCEPKSSRACEPC